MKILEINSTNYGSTGNIMCNISNIARESDIESYVACGKSKGNLRKELPYCMYIGNRVSSFTHRKLSYYTGYSGCFSYFSTKSFLKKVDKLAPDIIHLHNLHNAYINLPLLLRYIKRKKIPVIWTLHDCWAITGHCPFTIVKCSKWKTGCYDCPQYMHYPASLADNSKKMWALKTKWFTGISSMTIVTPSQWLADLVKQSYLKEYPVRVIRNGLDLSIFHPVESRFREEHGIKIGQKMLLGVAFGWGVRKGLDVFIKLAENLGKEYQIVLVGTNDEIDRILPSTIISIHKTENRNELAEIYSAADIFINPTREDNYPTVNMEAIACGTPVITFETGGSPESVKECGTTIPCDDFDALIEAIHNISKPEYSNICTSKAINFNENICYQEYIDLYYSMLAKR